VTDATEDIPSVDYVEGTGIPIRGNDIDTDQIIPARFMKVVTFDGLGQFSFFDLRFDDDDNEKDHPFNEERFQDANVMVVNNNFGCGSSREHAPQALMRWGIDAIIGEGFAEIFAGNCLALGIPTVTADHETINALQQWVDDNPDGEIEVDVRRETVTYGVRESDDSRADQNSESSELDNEINVSVDRAQREALVEGNWDTTALMKANENAIDETADSLPYLESAD